jgi:RHS repeat-associated protein
VTVQLHLGPSRRKRPATARVLQQPERHHPPLARRRRQPARHADLHRLRCLLRPRRPRLTRRPHQYQRGEDRQLRLRPLRRSNRHNITGNIATDLNPYVFTGGLKDRTTGWVKLGLRFYDPETGRFSQQDSLEVLADPSRGNRYQYAGSNPVNYVDPLGLSASSVTACFIACIALASGTGDGYSFSIGLGIGTPELSAGFAPGEDAESGGVVGEYSCGVGTLSASYTSDGEPGISVSTEEFSLVPSCSAITWFNIGF